MRRSRPSKSGRPESITSGRVTLLPGFVQSEVARRAPDRSRSVFRQIRERYAQCVNGDFGARIQAALVAHVPALEGSLKREIAQEAEAVDAVLAGRLDPADMNRKRPFRDEDKENFPVKFPHVPPTSWVFQTPPNRKLNFSQAKVEQEGLRPALLEAADGGRTVYEVKGRVNLARYSDGQKVEIDKRFLVAGGAEEFAVKEEEEEERKADQYELENHFLSLTCRPKKATCAASRLATMKRKRDIFEPEAGCSSELETVNEFDSSFTFINSTLNNLEESFTFKFTANEGATTGHLFDFDGNKKDSFNFHF